MLDLHVSDVWVWWNDIYSLATRGNGEAEAGAPVIDDNDHVTKFMYK